MKSKVCSFYCYRFEPLDEEAFRTLQQSLISYIQAEYIYGSAESGAPCTFFDYVILSKIKIPLCSLTQQIFAHANPILPVHLCGAMVFVFHRPICPYPAIRVVLTPDLQSPHFSSIFPRCS